MKRAVILLILGVLLCPAVYGVSKKEATTTAREFLHPFLLGDYEPAAAHSVGDLEEWAKVLTVQLPGDDRVSRFEIVDVTGLADSRRLVVWVERGEKHQVFYLDLAHVRSDVRGVG